MIDDTGKHDSRTLETGEMVHVTKYPGRNWGISSYDFSWFAGCYLAPGGIALGPRELKTATVFAQDIGWDGLRFDTEDDAYTFVAEQIRAGKAPGAKHFVGESMSNPA